MFEQSNIQYNLRSQTDCGLRALRYLGPKIWNIVPSEIKKTRDSCTIQDERICTHCSCNLCQPYFHCLRDI